MSAFILPRLLLVILLCALWFQDINLPHMREKVKQINLFLSPTYDLLQMDAVLLL